MSTAPTADDPYVVALAHRDPRRSAAVRALLRRSGYRVVPADLATRVDALVASPGAEADTGADVPTLLLGPGRRSATGRFAPVEQMADDPDADQELVLRVGILCRRGRSADRAVGGLLTVDHERREATTSAGRVALTVIEHRLLRALAARVGEVASRRSLVDLVWPPGARVARNTVDSHVRRLRAKLASIGTPLRIETVHGAGFRMVPLSL